MAADRTVAEGARRIDARPKPKDPAEELLKKLARWLVQQSEWPLLLALPRKVRKQFGITAGKIIFRIPTVSDPRFQFAAGVDLDEKPALDEDAAVEAKEMADVAADGS